MPIEPQIELLSKRHRSRFFILLVIVFIIALPSLIFYTTGYRLDFDNDAGAIVTTGGMYVTNDNLEVDVYLDGEQVKQPRLFRSAYYIQDIAAGQHRIVVQRPDLYTWVKELPIEPHIVVEVAAFNMPLVPHVRPITKYVTATGTPVYLGVKDTEDFFAGVTTTVPALLTKSTKVTTYEPNEEHAYVKSLFSTSTATAKRSVLSQLFTNTERFRFSTTTSTGEATTTEEIVERGNMRLVEREGELYAKWLGSDNSIPYYFCIASSSASTTAERYGEHVAKQMLALAHSTTTPIITVGVRVCRTEIRIDRMWQDVYFYDFYPNSSDLVLLQLEDGLYVTEIDDRAWQNSQRIYTGTDFETVVENSTIYIHDGNRYYELITEVEPI